MKRLRSIAVAVVGIVFVAGMSARGAESTGAPSPAEVAGAYLDAMAAADLDAAGALFTTDSLIFESGGVEGTWTRYREHHLGPELGHITAFEFDRGEPVVRESADGTMAYVAWPMEYRVTFKSDREPSDSRATVTFTLVLEKGRYRIAHLHWSRRSKS